MFLVLYCRYDPDGYTGHRKVALKAKTMQEAEVETIALLDQAWTRGPWEYHIYEVCQDSGPKLHPRG